MNVKKVNVSELKVGERYYVVCGLWTGMFTFCFSELVGKRIYYRFTVAPDAKDWEYAFGLFTTKSNFKVYKEI